MIIHFEIIKYYVLSFQVFLATKNRFSKISQLIKILTTFKISDYAVGDVTTPK